MALPCTGAWHGSQRRQHLHPTFEPSDTRPRAARFGDVAAPLGVDGIVAGVPLEPLIGFEVGEATDRDREIIIEVCYSL